MHLVYIAKQDVLSFVCRSRVNLSHCVAKSLGLKGFFILLDSGQSRENIDLMSLFNVMKVIIAII